MHNDDENRTTKRVENEHGNARAHGTSAARIDVRDLLQGRREILLLHKESEYRLRVTSNDKLILTK